MPRTFRFVAAAAVLTLAAGVLLAAPAGAVDTPTTSRIKGDDRYATSAKIGDSFEPWGTNEGVIYIASGVNFPDALSAAPAAALQGGLLMLTAPGSLPAVVKQQIARLNPSYIKVVGGEAAVSEDVFDELLPLAPNVVRIAGADRYETSRLIVIDAFLARAHGDTAYIATGLNFPDALSAASAAGSEQSPVLLVNGLAGSVDKPTIDVLKLIGLTKVYLAGGMSVLTSGIENSFDAEPTVTDVIRFAGANRYDTSVKINNYVFPEGRAAAFLATGTGFADALGGAAFAGLLDSPLYITPGNCVERGVYDDIVRLGPNHVFLFGGTAALSENVAALVPCDELE